MLVLLGHLHGTSGFPDLGIEPVFGDVANLGVVVFFVISGFLITLLLLKEWDRTGVISLRGFYARRAVRILPPAILFALGLAFASWRGWITLTPTDWITSLTYTVNYYPGRSWWVGHLWSLSVEEQFYLLWPLAMAVLGPRRSMIVAGAVVALGPVSRLVQRSAFANSPIRDLEIFPSVADALAMGCLLASLRARPDSERVLGWLRKGPIVGGLVLVAFVVNRWRTYTLVNAFGFSLICLVIALAIDWAVSNSAGKIGSFLNSRVMVAIGLLSYSLYLWQQPFLNRHQTVPITAFPMSLVATAIAATASYLLVERPLLAWRSRLRAR